ncbi:LysM peptidoglycan-binding domain-containing protein [Psychrobacillus sp. L3]|uniref:cell division suppressor protein YneA n=1 Tax=Psychrobacillus sp. L3 TaxID=3236891 RepID=UPI0036F35B77
MKLLKKNYFITLFIGLSLTFIMTIVLLNSQGERENYPITIEHGDSLWKLADKFGSEKSKEAWINEVMALNNLHTAHIKAGDTLIIPNGSERINHDYSTELAGVSR